MNLIIRLLVTAIVAYFLTMILPGVHFSGFGGAIIFSIVLGILNLIVKPVLKLLGLLFTLVINAVIILIADYFIDSMVVDGFWWALIFSILLSVITSLANSMFGDKD
jgi:putative membrane protein